MKISQNRVKSDKIRKKEKIIFRNLLRGRDQYDELGLVKTGEVEQKKSLPLGIRKYLRKKECSETKEPSRRLNRAERREARGKENAFKEIMKTMHHFFPELLEHLKKVRDPRDIRYVSHKMGLILLERIVSGMSGITSMRRMTEQLNTEECIQNMKKLLKEEEIVEIAHYDTINNTLKGVEVSDLEKILKYMVNTLIRKKTFEEYRLNKKYWLVAIDGTRLYKFSKKHCEHCLTQIHKKGTPEEYTLYFHYVLEAKLIIGDMALSLCNEFIENPEGEFDKQDCELKAFYRFAQKIKHTYPKLPICLLLDSLYANQEVFRICQENGWEYIIRFKDGSIPSVASEFDALSKYEASSLKVPPLLSLKDTEYSYVNEIDYEGYNINVVKYEEQGNRVEDKGFQFITSANLKITKKNKELIVATGRKRWEIENNGFNEQKNHGYALTHVFCNDCTAMKNHYILIQITHFIRQLFEFGFELKSITKSQQNISGSILENLRNKVLSDSDIFDIDKKHQSRVLVLL